MDYQKIIPDLEKAKIFLIEKEIMAEEDDINDIIEIAKQIAENNDPTTGLNRDVLFLIEQWIRLGKLLQS